MLTWAGLFQHVAELDPLGRRLQADRAEFERWAASAEQRVMDDLARIATARGENIRARTGIVVDVLTRIEKTSLSSFGGAHRLVALSLSGSSVDVYSVRSPGESPSIHFACARAATTSRFPVLVTVPGCLVVRAGRSEVRLLTVPGHTPTSIDAVVLRAFGLLVGAFQSALPSRTSAAPIIR